jgi:hypothetical protein
VPTLNRGSNSAVLLASVLELDLFEVSLVGMLDHRGVTESQVVQIKRRCGHWLDCFRDVTRHWLQFGFFLLVDLPFGSADIALIGAWVWEEFFLEPGNIFVLADECVLGDEILERVEWSERPHLKS